MNKGFEVIEAVHLFGVGADKIEVTVHRESILHSAVEYIDNSIIAELSVPDMRMCVQYAVDYPVRCPSASRELSLFDIGTLTFARPDPEAFPFLTLAKEAITLGGAMPAVLNAADEVAVAAFLDGRISFCQISEAVRRSFDALLGLRNVNSIDGLIEADKEARLTAEKFNKEY
jgi:1-deoxy-D-xylulose-5-phosphate reductoisomerase